MGRGAQSFGFPGAAGKCLQALYVELFQVLQAQTGQVGRVISIRGQVNQVQVRLFRKGNERILAGRKRYLLVTKKQMAGDMLEPEVTQCVAPVRWM